MLGRLNVKANIKYFFSVNDVPNSVPDSETQGGKEANKRI